MRNYDSMFAFYPSLIGTISTISGTAVGAPVDTIGFKDCLAILTAGAIAGSTGSTINLAIKIQEAASMASTNWTDITNGAVHAGSWDFDTVTMSATTGTHISSICQEQYERVGDGVRQRYIRAHATLTGTVGLGPKFAVLLVLGRNYDSSLVSNAVTQATNNLEYTKLY